jgi:hypothetical protein
MSLAVGNMPISYAEAYQGNYRLMRTHEEFIFMHEVFFFLIDSKNIVFSMTFKVSMYHYALMSQNVYFLHIAF